MATLDQLPKSFSCSNRSRRWRRRRRLAVAEAPIAAAVAVAANHVACATAQARVRAIIVTARVAAARRAGDRDVDDSRASDAKERVLSKGGIAWASTVAMPTKPIGAFFS